VISDPAVQAIVNGGTARYLTRGQKFERFMLWALVAAVAVLGGLYLITNGVAHKADTASRKANTSVQSQCQFYHDVANAPLGASTSPLGLVILADARIAYSGLNCTNGALAPADPRVQKLLPPGVN
jgi:hypothetical protein